MTFTYRQDFGFGNPNMAGAFFAVLVLAVFLVPARGRWLVALRFLISALFFGCLLLTASRGALVGLGLGSIAAWVASGFPRPKPGKWIVLCASVVLLSTVVGSRAIQRMASLSPSEGSTSSRIAVYRWVPAMVVAAPKGWGMGNAAISYENWFQDPGDSTSFKNLLSTHATWIVERGMLFLLAYSALWVLALTLCNPLALGVLVTWGTCAAFSHVGGAWWMWVIPALALGQALRDRWGKKSWPARPAWLVSSLLFVAVCVLFLLLGVTHAPSPAIRYDGRVVRVGSGQPDLWFLAPDVSVMGKTYGKMLRSMGNVAVARHWDDVRSPLVLSGNAPDPSGALACERLVWLNPPASISSALQLLVQRSTNKRIVWGAQRSDANPAALRAWFVPLPNAQWSALPGRGKYLGDALGCVSEL